MEYLSSSETLVSFLVGVIALLGSLKWAWSRIKIMLRARQNEQEKSTLDKCPAKRFLALFEAHGVYSTQIPSFFGHGLSIADCSTPEKLIEKLTEEVLRDAAELFAVKLEWLQGCTDKIYNVHNFYKHPEECKFFVSNLKEIGNDISGYALRPSKPNSTSYNSAIVLEEVIGYSNDRPISRIHIWGGWVDNYWKCRGYFAACASIAMNNDIWLIGNTCKHEWLSDFSSGHILPTYNFNVKELELENRGTWYVDEFLEVPEKFLDGVDSGHNNFGIHEAINLWLTLESQGYMCVDKYTNRKQVRDTFLRYKV